LVYGKKKQTQIGDNYANGKWKKISLQILCKAKKISCTKKGKAAAKKAKMKKKKKK
jgi:hypothetical protein